MTRPPDDAAPAPGWYPDPDGAPGMVRWWNGLSWSDVTTPAGPGVPVQHAPVLAPPSVAGTSGPEAVPPPVPAGSGGRGTIGWVVGLTVLVLVVVVAIGLLVGRSGGGDESRADPAPASSVPPGPTFAPGTVRIIDEAAGISYPYLGDGWYEWNLAPPVETTTTAGQYFTTQEVTPDGTTFIAQCTSGPLADGFGWAGESTLQTTLAVVADNVRANYYPGPNDRRVMRDEARTVDGHAARLYEFQLSWDVPGYDASGERAALLLIDVGRAAPALLYISIPNTHAELYGVIDVVLEDVDVL
jgi:hypothetical protein